MIEQPHHAEYAKRQGRRLNDLDRLAADEEEGRRHLAELEATFKEQEIRMTRLERSLRLNKRLLIALDVLLAVWIVVLIWRAWR